MREITMTNHSTAVTRCIAHLSHQVLMVHVLHRQHKNSDQPLVCRSLTQLGNVIICSGHLGPESTPDCCNQKGCECHEELQSQLPLALAWTCLSQVDGERTGLAVPYTPDKMGSLWLVGRLRRDLCLLLAHWCLKALWRLNCGPSGPMTRH